MWYIAAICLSVVLLAHLYACSRYPEGCYKVIRGVTFTGMGALIPETRNWIFLGGYIALSLSLVAFVPLYLSVKKQEQKTWGLLFAVVFEFLASLYLLVMSTINPLHAGPMVGLVAGSSVMNVVWYTDLEFGDMYDSL